jgi:hypothetical protein
MSGLDIAERRLPQDGKIKFKRKGIKPFELRVATLPTVGGYEDSVLRILAEAGAMKLDEVGLNERNLMIVKTVISHRFRKNYHPSLGSRLYQQTRDQDMDGGRPGGNHAAWPQTGPVPVKDRARFCKSYAGIFKGRS